MMDGKSEERICVVGRIRPLSSGEVASGHSCAVQAQDDKIYVDNPANSSNSKPKKYKLDAALGESASQVDVFNRIVPALNGAMDGINCSIFTYGQTGTGKTHTMLGYDLWQAASDQPSQKDCPLANRAEDVGIIPRSIQWIFDFVATNSKRNMDEINTQQKFAVRVSYVEIYNERIVDLLETNGSTASALAVNVSSSSSMAMNAANVKPTLDIRSSKNGEITVSGLIEKDVKSVDEVLQCLWDGAKARSIASTDMNEYSSRSHTIFMVHLKITGGVSSASGDGKTLLQSVKSKICFIDLAGSEKWKSSYDLSAKSTAVNARIKELTSINKSLSALGNCISALLKPNRAHIPYRDSKLTRLLQDSLGGNTRTVFVVTLSPSINNIEESLSTLQFADRAMKVQVFATVNMMAIEGASALENYQSEIGRLRLMIQTLLQKKTGAASPKSSGGGGTDDFALSDELSEQVVLLKEENAKLLQDLSKVQSDLRTSQDENTRILDAVFNSVEHLVDEPSSPTTGTLDITCQSSTTKNLSLQDPVVQFRVLQVQKDELERHREFLHDTSMAQEERWQWLQQYHTWLQAQVTQYSVAEGEVGSVGSEKAQQAQMYQRVCMMETSVLLQSEELQRAKNNFLKTNVQLEQRLHEANEEISKLKACSRHSSPVKHPHINTLLPPDDDGDVEKVATEPYEVDKSPSAQLRANRLPVTPNMERMFDQVVNSPPIGTSVPTVEPWPAVDKQGAVVEDGVKSVILSCQPAPLTQQLEDAAIASISNVDASNNSTGMLDQSVLDAVTLPMATPNGASNVAFTANPIVTSTQLPAAVPMPMRGRDRRETKSLHAPNTPSELKRSANISTPGISARISTKRPSTNNKATTANTDSSTANATRKSAMTSKNITCGRVQKAVGSSSLSGDQEKGSKAFNPVTVNATPVSQTQRRSSASTPSATKKKSVSAGIKLEELARQYLRGDSLSINQGAAKPKGKHTQPHDVLDGASVTEVSALSKQEVGVGYGDMSMTGIGSTGAMCAISSPPPPPPHLIPDKHSLFLPPSDGPLSMSVQSFLQPEDCEEEEVDSSADSEEEDEDTNNKTSEELLAIAARILGKHEEVMDTSSKIDVGLDEVNTVKTLDMHQLSADDGDWLEYFDEASGTPYYYNTRSQQTTWECPEKYNIVTT